MVATGCQCAYCYGRFTVPPQPFPVWMEQLMTGLMPILGIHNESERPNSCNLNKYETGQEAVGWHADDEDLFHSPGHKDVRIISLSLGSPRTFQLKSKGKGSPIVSIRLRSGDLCVMEGATQQHYLHRVPVEDATGPRVNLTWRWIVSHKGEACKEAPPL